MSRSIWADEEYKDEEYKDEEYKMDPVFASLLTFANAEDLTKQYGHCLADAHESFFCTLRALTEPAPREEKEETRPSKSHSILFANEDWKEMLRVGDALQQHLETEIIAAARPLTHPSEESPDTEALQARRKELLLTLTRSSYDIAKKLNDLKNDPELIAVHFQELSETINTFDRVVRQSEPTLTKTLAQHWGQMVRKVLVGLAIMAAITAITVFSGGLGLTVAIPLVGSGVGLGTLGGLGCGLFEAHRAHREGQRAWKDSARAKAALFSHTLKKVTCDEDTLRHCLKPCQ